MTRTHAPRPRAPRHRRAAGLRLVELLVGITVGLLVAAGAAVVATRQVIEHRRLMLAVQIQQDMRAAADLIQQDLRRAGFRGLPSHGVWEPERAGGTVPAKPALASPYAAVTQTAPGRDLFYQYAKPLAGSGQINGSNQLAPNEQFGLRLANKTLYLQVGLVNNLPNWQPITDPDVLEITEFRPVVTTQRVPLDDLCICPAGVACTLPSLTIQRVDITLQAVARADPQLRRTVQVSEPIRADDLNGACP